MTDWPRAGVDHIHHGEAGNRIAVEHVDQIDLRASRADDHSAVQEVAVHALVAQPGAQHPADGE